MHLIKSLHKRKEKYIPTKKQAKKWFDILNMNIFDNQLTPFDKIQIKDMGIWWACVTCDNEAPYAPMHLLLNNDFQSELQFVTIIGHEMIHKWQIQINGDTGSHNKHFFSWRTKFNENGLELNRTV